MILRVVNILFLVSLGFSCSTNEKVSPSDNLNSENIGSRTVNVLSLGDSYTIGQSVCESCRFPEQLKIKIEENLEVNDDINLEVVARTGWTTSDLILNLDTQELQSS